VPVYMGHADLLWASDWPRPRFGLGAFGIALEALFKEATGEDCPTRYYGKPQPGPFRWLFVECQVLKFLVDLLSIICI